MLRCSNFFNAALSNVSSVQIQTTDSSRLGKDLHETVFAVKQTALCLCLVYSQLSAFHPNFHAIISGACKTHCNQALACGVISRN